MIRLLVRAARLGAASVTVFVGLSVAAVALFAVLDPPATALMARESDRLGAVQSIWRPLDEISPALRRAAVSAEDAGFCGHFGVEIGALRLAWAAYRDGRAAPGGSTITQQTAKNVFLWPERSLFRKGLELWFALLMEAFWGKERILEIYLNVAEFGEGVFGVEAAAQDAFGRSAQDLVLWRAARLVSVLPAPRSRSPDDDHAEARLRFDRIVDGARTISADGRDACFVAPNRVAAGSGSRR